MAGLTGSAAESAPLRTELTRQAEKASRLIQSRVWRDFDTFVTKNTPRWEGRAATLLAGEGTRAADGYERFGATAAEAAVQDREWLEYLERLWMTVVPEAAELILPYLETVKAARPIADPFLQAAVNWLKANGAREAAMISNTSRKGIADQIRIGMIKNETQEQIAERIRKRYRSIGRSRAERIAHTEVHAASNYGSLTAAQESGQRLAKIWVNTPDNRVRDEHVEAGGQKQPLNAAFIIDGERLMHPGDSSLGASSHLVVNCRCYLFFVAGRRAMPRPRRVA